MDLSQVTLSQMRYAVAVDDARSFREAADRCHVSQSGLSMQIRKLEELLDLVLFDRGRKPVQVTEGGRAAIDQMRRMLRELERLGPDRSRARRARRPLPPRGDPHPRGHGPALVPGPARRTLAPDRAHGRGAQDRGDHRPPRRGYPRRGDRLHSPGGRGLQEDVLGHEALFAYLPPGDPLLRKKSIAQADLAERELWVMPEGHCFRSQVLSYCRSGAPIPAPVRFESGSFETLIRLVDEGLGATVLPASWSRASRRAGVAPRSGPWSPRDRSGRSVSCTPGPISGDGSARPSSSPSGRASRAPWSRSPGGRRSSTPSPTAPESLHRTSTDAG